MRKLNSLLALVFVVCSAVAAETPTGMLQDGMLNLLGAWTTGPCSAVSADSEFVYLSKGSTLEILDMSAGSAPVLISSLLGTTYIVQVAVSGPFAYMVRETRTNERYSLSICDISNPRSPVEAATYDLGPSFKLTNRICVSGDYLYVPFWEYRSSGGDLYGWLGILDVSKPTTPHEVGRTKEFKGGAVRVHVAGEYAYVTTLSGGLDVFDIGNPADPLEVAFFGTTGSPVDFAIEGNRLFVVSRSDLLEVFDISRPLQPTNIGACKLDYPMASHIAVSGQCAYVTHDSILSVIVVGDPANPRTVAQVAVDRSPQDVCKTSKCLYVAGGRKGLHVFDLTQPAFPVRRTTYRTGSLAHDCVVSGNLAFIAHQQDGMSIVDISTPSDPRTVGFFSKDVEYPVIDVDGARAYLVGTSPEWPTFPNYLAIINVVDPKNVREVGRVALEGRASDIQVERNYAYVLLQDGGLKVFNIENPSEPAEVGFCQVMTEGYSIFVQDQYAFVAGELRWGNEWFPVRIPRLCIISIADPSKPMVYGMCDGLGNLYSEVYVESSRAYVAGYHGPPVLDQGPPGTTCLDIVDVSSPSRPSAVCHFDTTEDWQWVFDLCVSGGHVYCATGYGIQILDATDPSRVRRTAQFRVGRGASVTGAHGGFRSVTVANGRIVLQAEDGLYILQENIATDAGEEDTSPTAFYLRQNYPNPFNPTTVISFQLPVVSMVRLVVYDLLGREVAVLVNERREAGQHEVRFDASGISGGMYVYRLRAGDYVATKRMIVMR